MCTMPAHTQGIGKRIDGPRKVEEPSSKVLMLVFVDSKIIIVSRGLCSISKDQVLVHVQSFQSLWCIEFMHGK